MCCNAVALNNDLAWAFHGSKAVLRKKLVHYVSIYGLSKSCIYTYGLWAVKLGTTDIRHGFLYQSQVTWFWRWLWLGSRLGLYVSSACEEQLDMNIKSGLFVVMQSHTVGPWIQREFKPQFLFSTSLRCLHSIASFKTSVLVWRRREVKTLKFT